MFCVSNDEVNLRRSTKTKHSPGIRTIADFTSCRTKPSSLLIYFLQFLPQTVTSHPIPHRPVASQSFGWCENSSEALNIARGKPKWEKIRSQTDITELHQDQCCQMHPIFILSYISYIMWAKEPKRFDNLELENLLYNVCQLNTKTENIQIADRHSTPTWWGACGHIASLLLDTQASLSGRACRTHLLKRSCCL